MKIFRNHNPTATLLILEYARMNARNIVGTTVFNGGRGSIFHIIFHVFNLYTIYK